MGNLIKILIKLMVSLLVFISAKVTYDKKTLMKSTILSFTVSSYMTQQQPAAAMQQQSFPYGAVPQNPMVSNTFSQNHSTWSFLCLKTEDSEDHWNLRALVGQSFMAWKVEIVFDEFLGIAILSVCTTNFTYIPTNQKPCFCRLLMQTIKDKLPQALHPWPAQSHLVQTRVHQCVHEAAVQEWPLYCRNLGTREA